MHAPVGCSHEASRAGSSRARNGAVCRGVCGRSAGPAGKVSGHRKRGRDGRLTEFSRSRLPAPQPDAFDGEGSARARGPSAAGEQESHGTYAPRPSVHAAFWLASFEKSSRSARAVLVPRSSRARRGASRSRRRATWTARTWALERSAACQRVAGEAGLVRGLECTVSHQDMRARVGTLTIFSGS